MTDREAFESWAGKRERYHTTREWDAMHRAWQAATAAERERCAKVCENVAKRQSYGHAKAAAGDCADFIRSGE